MDYKKELDYAIEINRKNAEEFKFSFPESQSVKYRYYHSPGLNNGWGEGFFSGMQMLAYEETGDRLFLDSAVSHLDLFYHKIKNKLGVDHHDMGFLYTLGAISVYKVTDNELAKKTAIMAADQLMTRYVPKGKFIRAWGPMNTPTGNRLIIDCLINIPLLFWASEVTGDPKYREVAENHLYTTLKVIIRDDNTTHHTFFFDPETGAPDHGETAQGKDNDSVWARGQAWGVLGTAIAYHYTKDPMIIDKFKALTDKFIELLPENSIPYWDMTFGDGSGEERDTSAAAIACCGILQMGKYIDISKYMPMVEKMMTTLSEQYTARRLDFETNIILTDAMYSKPAGHKAEANIWGDYYYMEALMRLVNPDWEMYW